MVTVNRHHRDGQNWSYRVPSYASRAVHHGRPMHLTHPVIHPIRRRESSSLVMDGRTVELGRWSRSTDRHGYSSGRTVSSIGECSTVNWVRILQSKKNDYHNFYRIWPHLRRPHQLRNPEDVEPDSLERQSCSVHGNSDDTWSTRDPPYAVPFEVNADSAMQPVESANRRNRWKSVFDFIKLFGQNEAEQMWQTLSTAYAQLLVLLIVAFYLRLYSDDPPSADGLRVQHGAIMAYLYAGGCCVLTGFNITLAFDKFLRFQRPKAAEIDPHHAQKLHFATRGHTPFHLRWGAIVLGIVSLTSSSLEVVIQAVADKSCTAESDITWAYPLLQTLFTLMQTVFLFRPKISMNKFGGFGRIGFAHLMATSVLSCIRVLVWEPNFGFFSAESSSFTFPEDLTVDIEQCMSGTGNAFNRFWKASLPYLVPFMVYYRLKLEFHLNLISSAVAYAVWTSATSPMAEDGSADQFDRDYLTKRNLPTDCHGTTKGLFLGLVVFIISFVVVVLFFMMKDNANLVIDLFWLCTWTQVAVLGATSLVTVLGFVQLNQLTPSAAKQWPVDVILNNVTQFGVFAYAVSGLIVSGADLNDNRHLVVFVHHCLLLVQTICQNVFLGEASKRCAANRYQAVTKPGRQVLTFLLMANVTMWMTDMLLSPYWIQRQFQQTYSSYYGMEMSFVFSQSLLMAYRFHSFTVLLGLWRHVYRMPV